MINSQTARAKVNLSLHVTGRRADGYHLLDSLVVFAEIGDVVSAEPAGHSRLKIDGPFAHDLNADGDNLVLDAARLLPEAPVSLTLVKNLPVVSGIGGGSADAAAALHAICNLTGTSMPSAAEQLGLGADVPVCVAGKTCRMSGIGEALEFVPDFPVLSAVLINPKVQISTKSVFEGLAGNFSGPLDSMPSFSDGSEAAKWLASQRNDLQTLAIEQAPAVGSVLDVLAGRKNCLCARMSGSGATCFGLFQNDEQAQIAAADIAASHPSWWVKHTRLAAS